MVFSTGLVHSDSSTAQVAKSTTARMCDFVEINFRDEDMKLLGKTPGVRALANAKARLPKPAMHSY